MQGTYFLVKFIQLRRDKLRKVWYDFLPSYFLSELKLQFNKFTAAKEKDKFFFSTLSRIPFTTCPTWLDEVDVIYCSMKIESQHWVGVVIDFKKWSITVLDCNTACLSDAQLQNYLCHISTMLSFLMHKHGQTVVMQAVSIDLLPITRVDLLLLNEVPCKMGFNIWYTQLYLHSPIFKQLVSCAALASVSSIILLEQHVVGQLS